jgi:AcrR family transcriptional regulator
VGTTERRAREKKFLREEILDAARELFLKHGYENVSMRKIAEKIEYSPTTIYLYFHDKAEILHTICEETFNRLSKVMLDIEHGPGDPVAKLRQQGVAYIRFGLEHPNHYQVTFMVPHDYSEKTAEELTNSAGMRTFQSLVNCVQACVDSREFRSLDVIAASQALWCAVHGVTSLLIAQFCFPWVQRDQLVATLVDAMIDGYRAIPKSKHRN